MGGNNQYMRPILGLLAIVPFLFMSFTALQASDFVGDGYGALLNSMGGALGAAKNHPDTLYVNPAGMAGIKQFTLASGYQNGFGGFNSEYFMTAACPLNDMVLGMSVPINMVSDILRTQENSGTGQGQSIGNVTQLYSAALLGVAWHLNDFCQVGINGRAYYLRLDSYTGTGFGFDAGLRWQPMSLLSLGLSARHLGNMQLRWSSGATETYGAQYSLAAATHFALDSLQFWPELRLDYQSTEQRWLLKTGVELGLDEFLKLRGGYRGDTGQWTLGLGLDAGDFGLDYALLTHDTLGLTHQAVLIFKL